MVSTNISFNSCVSTIITTTNHHVSSINPFLFQLVPNDGSVRLVDGNSYSGRVQIFYNVSWFSICGRGWSDADAHVVCRQLGMEPGSRWDLTSAASNDSRMLLIDVGCTGHEESLSECTLPLVTDGDDCNAHDTAAVTCTGKHFCNGHW